MSGAGFGAGLKAGLIGGGLAAAFGGVSGGLIRGFTDMAKGYSFWDGYGTSEFVIGTTGNYEDIAKTYNASPTAESNDALLKSRMLEEFDVVEGDYNISKMTTKPSDNYGLTSENGVYVNNKTNATVAGYTQRLKTGTSVHVSPAYTKANLVDFKAVAGHELIHAYHYNMFKGKSFNRSFSESIAYRYSVNVYLEGGNINSALSMYMTASKLSYWNTYSEKYVIPKILRFLW